MYKLIPNDGPGRDFGPDEMYSTPELDFTVEGVELENGTGRRPYVFFNMVSSVDGKATSASQDASGLGSPSDQRLMARLRLAADGVLVGASTLRQDPWLPDIKPEFAEERARYFPDLPHPVGCVLSSDGNLPMDKKFWQGPRSRRVVFLGQKADAKIEQRMAEKVQVFRLPDDAAGRPDVKAMMQIMHEQLGLRRLLCEGGPTLNNQLMLAGLADELFLTFAPKIVGGQENTTIVNGTGYGLSPDQLLQLRLLSLYQNDSELFLRYRFQAGR